MLFEVCTKKRCNLKFGQIEAYLAQNYYVYIKQLGFVIPKISGLKLVISVRFL